LGQTAIAASCRAISARGGHPAYHPRGVTTGQPAIRWYDLLELNGADLRREPIEVRKATLASILRKSRPGVRLNEHLEHPEGAVVFQHACKMGLEGIVSKRLGSRYRSGRSPDWLKFKNPAAPAVRREAEEDWGRR
jgi:bifunctional non-homologous end joining protein LigD